VSETDGKLCIAHEALRVSFLFQYGVLTADEVIGWADSMIIQLDSLPDSLLELSMISTEKTADIVSCLRRLRSEGDYWAALRAGFPQIRQFIISHPDQAERIANQLFRTACFSPQPIPKDLNFMFSYDDKFSLARDGIFGDLQAVYSSFIAELEKFG
jgi:hypothetical protein